MHSCLQRTVQHCFISVTFKECSKTTGKQVLISEPISLYKGLFMANTVVAMAITFVCPVFSAGMDKCPYNQGKGHYYMVSV